MVLDLRDVRLGPEKAMLAKTIFQNYGKHTDGCNLTNVNTITTRNILILVHELTNITQQMDKGGVAEVLPNQEKCAQRNLRKKCSCPAPIDFAGLQMARRR